MQIVQDALDAAQVGRTSITIAHRLSTIKTVDQIYIIDNGQIVEHGSHDELMRSKSVYEQLHQQFQKNPDAPSNPLRSD